MKAEKEVSFFDLIREFNIQRIRYLIIGRRAIILYGGPVLTGDRWTLRFLGREDRPAKPVEQAAA